jgi:hypothetical protein
MDLLLHSRSRFRTIRTYHGVSFHLPLQLTFADGYDPFSWGHEICNEDNEERAIVIASMNEMAYVLQAWLPLIVWQQIEAPQYQKGFVTITFLSALLIVTAFIVKFLWRRELLRYDPSLSWGLISLIYSIGKKDLATINSRHQNRRLGALKITRRSVGSPKRRRTSLPCLVPNLTVPVSLGLLWLVQSQVGAIPR